MSEGNCWQGFEPYAEEPGKSGRLLVREIKEGPKMKGLLLIPESVKSSHKLYEVLAGSQFNPNGLSKGMTVMSGVYSGLEFDLGEEHVQLISTADILGIIHEPQEKEVS